MYFYLTEKMLVITFRNVINFDCKVLIVNICFFDFEINLQFLLNKKRDTWRNYGYIKNVENSNNRRRRRKFLWPTFYHKQFSLLVELLLRGNKTIPKTTLSLRRRRRRRKRFCFPNFSSKFYN